MGRLLHRSPQRRNNVLNMGFQPETCNFLIGNGIVLLAIISLRQGLTSNMRVYFYTIFRCFWLTNKIAPLRKIYILKIPKPIS